MTLIETALIGVGIAAGIWWPDHGTGHWVRERLLRPVLTRLGAQAVCDCIICLSFWCAAGAACAVRGARCAGVVEIVASAVGSGFIALGLAFALVQAVGVRREQQNSRAAEQQMEQRRPTAEVRTTLENEGRGPRA